MRRKTLFVGMCLFVAHAGLAWGQGTTSRLTGVVTDSSGAVVPVATVVLTNEGTGISFQTARPTRARGTGVTSSSAETNRPA